VEQATLKESKLNITYGCLAEVGQGPGATRSLGLCAALAVFAAVALLSGCSAAHPAESAKPVVGTSATPSAKTTATGGCKVWSMLSNPYQQSGDSSMATVLLVIPADSSSPLCEYIAKTSAGALINDYGYSVASTKPSGPHCRVLAPDGSLVATAYGTVPVGAAGTDTPLSGICDGNGAAAAVGGWDVTIGDAAIGKSADPNVASLANRF
jgi:hypothetical protein